jgi:hypothetical protein
MSRRELIVLVLLFAFSVPAVTARLYSSDEVEYFSYLRSLWFDHDVSFQNEYQYFYDHQIAQSGDFHKTFLELQTPAGRRINYGTMGCAILWSPFYAGGDVVARLMRAAGQDVAVDGYSRPYVSAVAYGSAFYGFATILLGIRAARRIVGAHALGAGLAVWAGTPILFYMYVAPPFSHACSAFSVALLVTIWLHVRKTWTVPGTIALGLSAALVAMVREQDILFALGPALDCAITLMQARETRRRATIAVAALAGCAAFAVGYLPQLLAYQALNGRPRPSELVTRKMSWNAPHALQVLGSPEHGFLFWTPLAILAIAGLLIATFRVRPNPGAGQSVSHADRRRVAACMLLMIALQVYISGAVESWTVAGAFGQRRFVAVTMLLIVGLAALREAVRMPPARVMLTIAIAASIWWNIALMAQFGTSMMDRQRLEPRRNAYDAFVTLPRIAPGLLYRYFAHRASFYKPPTAEQPRER